MVSNVQPKAFSEEPQRKHTPVQQLEAPWDGVPVDLQQRCGTLPNSQACTDTDAHLRTDGLLVV